MRFCQSFMTELCRHIGPNVDVPAGDIGVGAREIGYMFGQYKRLTNKFEGVLTGKGLEFGGSLIRTEATGYGAVYFLKCMLDKVNGSLEGANVVISGSGNVATFAAEKCLHLGAKVLTLSDSGGYIHDPDGITQEKLEWVMDLKNVRRGRISEYADEYPGATYHEGRPWGVACDYALPCATQNEINEDEAKLLIKNGCKGVSEGANMPTSVEGINAYLAAGILYGPSKAANAGGVAVSGMEMSQNSARLSWTEDELQKLLLNTMQDIHDSCYQFGNGKGVNGSCDYLVGSNVAGFVKIADAMLAYGVS
jgi:glutamate dehydrogenase (NADP+)